MTRKASSVGYLIGILVVAVLSSQKVYASKSACSEILALFDHKSTLEWNPDYATPTAEVRNALTMPLDEINKMSHGHFSLPDTITMDYKGGGANRDSAPEAYHTVNPLKNDTPRVKMPGRMQAEEHPNDLVHLSSIAAHEYGHILLSHYRKSQSRTLHAALRAASRGRELSKSLIQDIIWIPLEEVFADVVAVTVARNGEAVSNGLFGPLLERYSKEKILSGEFPKAPVFAEIRSTFFRDFTYQPPRNWDHFPLNQAIELLSKHRSPRHIVLAEARLLIWKKHGETLLKGGPERGQILSKIADSIIAVERILLLKYRDKLPFLSAHEISNLIAERI